jgi:CBS domain-containing protein
MLTVLTSLKMKRQAAFEAITYCGCVVSILSICAGSVLIFKESIQNGLWWIIAGLHLLEGNRFTNTANILNNNLKGETVADYMRPNPLTVPLHTPLREFILEYYYRYKLGIFPVLDSGKVEGFITLAKIRGIKECDWNGYTVADFTEPCTEKNTITPSNDIMDALSIMYRQSTSHLLVLQYGELAGVLSSKDLVKFLELKIDLVTK